MPRSFGSFLRDAGRFFYFRRRRDLRSTQAGSRRRWRSFLDGRPSESILASQRRFSELPEKRMRVIGLGTKFGVKLASNEPGMVHELDDLDKPPVGARSRDDHPACFHFGFVFIIELIAMAVALVDGVSAIGAVGL